MNRTGWRFQLRGGEDELSLMPHMQSTLHGECLWEFLKAGLGFGGLGTPRLHRGHKRIVQGFLIEDYRGINLRNSHMSYSLNS